MKATIANKITDKRLVPIVVFLIFFFIFKVTSAGDSPYNYFTRLADAFNHGRLYLKNSEPWLSELIPTQQGYFVPYSPLPAIIAMPFVYLFPTFSQTLLTHILGALIPVAVYLTAKHRNVSGGTIVYLTILSGIGTILWFESAVGSSWYLGQVAAALCLVTAICIADRKGSVFFVGLFLGAAYLSRVHSILSLPFFLYLLRSSFLKNKQLLWKAVILFGCGIGIFVLGNAIYNMARFGVIWDKGYLLIPGVLDEPWFAKGILHYSYIPHNLYTLFFSLPMVLPSIPYIQPSWNGLSILITTPAFVLLLKSKFKDWEVRFAILSCLLIAGFVLMHGSNGFAQFGYREPICI
jgi:hypothetical protein